MTLRDYAHKIGYGPFFDALAQNESWYVDKANTSTWSTERQVATMLADRTRGHMRRFVLGMAIRELFNPTGKPKKGGKL